MSARASTHYYKHKHARLLHLDLLGVALLVVQLGAQALDLLGVRRPLVHLARLLLAPASGVSINISAAGPRVNWVALPRTCAPRGPAAGRGASAPTQYARSGAVGARRNTTLVSEKHAFSGARTMAARAFFCATLFFYDKFFTRKTRQIP